MKTRSEYVSEKEDLSIRRQCKLLSVSRSSVYYKPAEESTRNLKIMSILDRRFLEEPSHGVLRIQDHLRDIGVDVNVKLIRRLLRKMGIMALYPKRNLSKQGETKYIYPYLLRGKSITFPNQVWEIDITYIPMKHGFMYLTAIIDVYSRFIVGWDISNSLAASNCLNVLKRAVAKHGKPHIVNSDQGCQFTCEKWVEFLADQEIQISMDGKGRALDNIYIERFWRSVKYDYVYITPNEDAIELYRGIAEYFGQSVPLNTEQSVPLKRNDLVVQI